MNLEQFPNFKKFLHKNILALDYGEKVIGLATFSPGKDPYPLPFGKIENKNPAYFLSELTKILNDEVIDAIVLGLPLLLDGKESTMTQKIRTVGEMLGRTFPTIPLHYQDETLSSFEAEERMKNSPRYNFKVNPKEIDALSASIILEDFIRI